MYNSSYIYFRLLFVFGCINKCETCHMSQSSNQMEISVRIYIFSVCIGYLSNVSRTDEYCCIFIKRKYCYRIGYEKTLGYIFPVCFLFKGEYYWNTLLFSFSIKIVVLTSLTSIENLCRGSLHRPS